MNNKRRKEIAKIVEQLELLNESLETLHSDESDALDNIPEGLEGSDMYNNIESAVENLQEAMDSMTDAIDYLNCAIE